MAVPQDIKRIFVTNFYNKLTDIINKIDECADMKDQFTEKGFNAGGSDPITDDHLANIGTDTTELALGAALVTNLIKFIDNDTPAAADYRATFDKLRTDFGITR